MRSFRFGVRQFFPSYQMPSDLCRWERERLGSAKREMGEERLSSWIDSRPTNAEVELTVLKLKCAERIWVHILYKSLVQAGASEKGVNARLYLHIE